MPLAAVVVRDSPTAERTDAGKLKTEEGVYALRAGKAVLRPLVAHPLAAPPGGRDRRRVAGASRRSRIAGL